MVLDANIYLIKRRLMIKISPNLVYALVLASGIKIKNHFFLRKLPAILL